MSHQKVVVFDTSVILCWLQIPGKDTCGPTNDIWNYERVNNYIQEHKETSIFVLPLASLIESGNHIAQCNGDRFQLAKKFCDEIISQCIDAKKPWATFEDQTNLWSADSLSMLASSWPTLAASKLSLGDATIKFVAEKYAEAGIKVEILTGDQGLKMYEPISIQPTPRRRR